MWGGRGQKGRLSSMGQIPFCTVPARLDEKCQRLFQGSAFGLSFDVDKIVQNKAKPSHFFAKMDEKTKYSSRRLTFS